MHLEEEKEEYILNFCLSSVLASEAPILMSRIRVTCPERCSPETNKRPSSGDWFLDAGSKLSSCIRKTFVGIEMKTSNYSTNSAAASNILSLVFPY